MEDWSRYEAKFRYMMLDRFRQDCDYSLNRCDGSENVLWSKDKKAQIENMKAIWKTFSANDTPEWLTWEDILEYARRFGVDLND
jgi:hypothetical protein